VTIGAGDIIEKSCPVPLNATVWGLPDPSSLIVIVPALVPLAVGSKNTPMTQLAPAARLLPQALSVPKSDGLAVTPVMFSGEPPLFVSVTFCGRPEVPTYWLGKEIFEGVTDTVGGGMPPPASGTGTGLEERLFEIARLAIRAPVAAGVKVTLIEQLAPADKVPTQLSVSAKSEAFPPFIETVVTVRAVDSLLVSVTVWGALVVPVG